MQRENAVDQQQQKQNDDDDDEMLTHNTHIKISTLSGKLEN